MGNSPSADLGGGSAHSSRDVGTANPEMEVKRSIASRTPTHNEYNELPASSKPHKATKHTSGNGIIKLFMGEGMIGGAVEGSDIAEGQTKMTKISRERGISLVTQFGSNPNQKQYSDIACGPGTVPKFP